MPDQLYLIYVSSHYNNSYFLMKNITANDILYASFIYFNSPSKIYLSSIILTQAVLFGNTAFFYFQNSVLLMMENIQSSSFISNPNKSPLIYIYDVIYAWLKGLSVTQSDGLTIEIQGKSYLEADDVHISNSSYTPYLLFSSDLSIFSLKNFKLIQVSAKQTINHIILSLRSSVFNLSTLYFTKISGEAFLDYRNALSVFISDFLIENNMEVRTFFLGTTTFYSTQLSNVSIINSILPRFAEFISNSIFNGYTPALKMMGLKFLNLTLPATNAEIFAGFGKMNTMIIDSVFENVKRIDIGAVTPIGIFVFSRLGGIDFYNCSFKAVGYSFPTRNLQVIYNYPLISVSYLMRYSVRFSVFESDETVSLNCGFVFSGQIYVTTEISNCKFFVRNKNPNFTYTGLKLMNSMEVIFFNNSFSNISCTPYHLFNHQLRNGAIMILGEDSLTFIKNSKNLTIKNLFFENCNCENGGALHFSNYHKATVENVFFQNNFANIGGSWGIISSTDIKVSNIIIVNSFANEAASVLLSNIVTITLSNYKEFLTKGIRSGPWKIDNSNVFCSNITVFNTRSETNGGLGILFASSITITLGVILETSARNYGGCFFTTLGSKVILTRLTIEKSEAEYGGVISGDDAQLIYVSEGFAKSAQATINGACFYFESVALSILDNFTIIQGLALNNGMVHFKSSEESSQIKIFNLVCKQNKALSGSCIYFLSSSQLMIDGVTISECVGVPLILRNQLLTQILVSKLQAFNISGVESLFDVNGIIVVFWKFLIENCTFDQNLGNFKAVQGRLTDIIFYNITSAFSGKLHLIQIKNSIIVIQKLSFTNFEPYQTSLLKVESSHLNISDSNIDGGSGDYSVIYLEKGYFFGELLKFKRNKITCITIGLANLSLINSQFLYNQELNKREDKSSDIYVMNKNYFNSFVLLENITSLINSSGLINYFSNFQSLLVKNCSFLVFRENFGTTPESMIQGVQVLNVKESIFENNLFEGFLGSNGPALKVASVSREFESVLTVLNNSFNKCVSLKGGGGAVSFSNIDELKILNNRFTKNKAQFFFDFEGENSGKGGCGLILCYKKNCSVVLKNNSYLSNTADAYGPLFVSNTSLKIDDLSLGRENYDELAFSNVSTNFPPKVLIKLPDEGYWSSDSIFLNEKYENTKFFELGLINRKFVIKSGQQLSLEIILTDEKGQVLVFDNKSTCSIENSLFASRISTIKYGFSIANKGTFFFKDLTLLNIPNTSANIIISIKIPRNIILNEDPEVISFPLEIFFLPCVRGEVIQSDYSCYKCPEGSFSYLDPMKDFRPEEVSSNPQKCVSCSEITICPGGQYDFPRPNFWRPAENTSKIFECMIPEACEGPGNFSEVDRMGKCAEGHFGNLCHDCKMGFGKLNQNFICEPCREAYGGILTRLILISLTLFFYAIAASYLYSIRDSKIEAEGYLFVYLKIGLNFFQIVNLLSFMKFKWVLPTLKKLFINSSNSVSLATEDVLLNDCIIQEQTSSIENLYAYKVIVIIFLPIFFGIMTSIFWFSHYWLYKKWLIYKKSEKRLKLAKSDFLRKLLASVVISIFLFHPLIIRSCLSLLNCFQINEEEKYSDTFLFISPSFLCWSSFHIKVVLIFAIPGIVIWGVLFPMLLMYVLVKQKLFRKKFRFNIELKYQNEAISPRINVGAVGSGPVIPKIVIGTDQAETGGYHKKQKKSLSEAILSSNIFKFLYYGYKDEYIYWECLNFIKKLLISLLINMNRIIGFDIIVLLIIAILFISFFMQLNYKPFVRYDLNFIEMLSQVSIIIIFSSIIMLSTNLPYLLLYVFGLIIIILYMILCAFTVFFVTRSLKEFNIVMALWKNVKSSVASMSPQNHKKKNSNEGKKSGFSIKPADASSARSKFETFRK